MPSLVPGIHISLFLGPHQQDVGGRDNKPGHDEMEGQQP
jgi:hypothetical protein